MADSEGTSLVTRLRSIPLFGELEDPALERIAGTVAEFDVAAGHVLIQPHTAGAGLFVLEEGTVEVQGGHEPIELGPGEFFGELALLDEGATRTARVQAKTPASGICIARDEFTSMLVEEPRLCLSLAKALARRLAGMVDHH